MQDRVPADSWLGVALPKLQAFARYLSADPAVADRLVSKTCEVAGRNLGGRATDAELPADLYRILRSLYHRAYRVRTAA